ncbi:PAS domain-containing sensor histidine kinase [Sphingosinicella ginsenosidimutans]|uniref:histidine kinase n=1 Tax=Allosphingosinicella ginsenosidimutans TaxID=1176539 RepID=A0A5C6TS65_9SPHN|nr:PAS domain-containing sensor histidine kinase [Sphingosinicella ginsenosidimutans]TXC63049.1 PAS domain S-box protein [Sphingosinicella ginsenosidimutans]
MTNGEPETDIGDARAFDEGEQFRALVQSVHDYAIFMLDADGYVASWNPGAERIKGYKAGEIIGQHFSRFYTEEDRANGEPARALATAGNEGKFEKEVWRCRKDGSRFWASVVIDPIRDDDGTVIGFAKITRDITERRDAQQELERAREALAQAQKMEAVGRLTGGVAHDFNNLLTVIRASVDMLRRPGLAAEKRERYLSAISDTADRASLLTGQLLVFARRQPLHNERFAIAPRVERMRQILATTLGSPIRLILDLAEDSGTVFSDPTQFETAILNMAINARDAMPSGGQLRISARRVEGAPTAAGQVREGPFVAVAVEDNGIGIDDETQARMFEPFFTTKAIGKGTGLGLSQVYGFVKTSEGEVTVQSSLGEGARFTLYLPLVGEEAGPDAGSDEEADRAATPIARQRILLVEDNEEVGTFASGLLGELGQDVVWAHNAVEALAALDADEGAFDLVFSDVVMPGDNGVLLAQEVRRRWPALRVVLTSGYSHVLAEEGSHGFELLRKPYSVDSLVAMIAGRSRRSA